MQCCRTNSTICWQTYASPTACALSLFSCREAPALPGAPETLQFVEKLIDGALSTFEAEAHSSAPESEGTSSQPARCQLSTRACEQIRDAAMMAMLAGHICLTVRISIIRSIKASCFSNTPCTHQGCTLSNCLGNRLEVIEQHDDSLDVPQYRIVVPHHKTATRGIMMPPVKIYSRKLRRLLQIWERNARPQVNATPIIVLHAAGVPCVAGNACVMLVDNAQRHTASHVCWYSCMFTAVQMVRRLAAKYKDWQDPETLFFTNRGLPFPKLSHW